MSNRNYIIATLACLTLGSLLAGCGGKDGADATATKTDSAATATSGAASPDSSKGGATGGPSLSNPGGSDTGGKGK